ncbi:hypothetical protein [Hyphomonas sp.]|uniref:hypothetical protein n=1 Tax=Hyphomonas sp. TaxID=87 RepID=UPI00391B076F
MQLTEIAAVIGLSLGALMGLGAMISPRWASGVVRLVADPAKPGGYSEFRGTYGGLFFMVHAVALAIVLATPPTASALATLPVAAGWLGAALGRALSLLLDREQVAGARIIPIWMATEVALGLAIGAPVLHLLG